LNDGGVFLTYRANSKIYAQKFIDGNEVYTPDIEIASA